MAFLWIPEVLPEEAVGELYFERQMSLGVGSEQCPLPRLPHWPWYAFQWDNDR